MKPFRNHLEHLASIALVILLWPILIPLYVWTKKRLLGVPVKDSIITMFGGKPINPNKPQKKCIVLETSSATARNQCQEEQALLLRDLPEELRQETPPYPGVRAWHKETPASISSITLSAFRTIE